MKVKVTCTWEMELREDAPEEAVREFNEMFVEDQDLGNSFARDFSNQLMDALTSGVARNRAEAEAACPMDYVEDTFKIEGVQI